MSLTVVVVVLILVVVLVVVGTHSKNLEIKLVRSCSTVQKKGGAFYSTVKVSTSIFTLISYQSQYLNILIQHLSERLRMLGILLVLVLFAKLSKLHLLAKNKN